MPQEMICIVIWALHAIPLETIKKALYEGHARRRYRPGKARTVVTETRPSTQNRCN